jgi:hypothetical protein
MVNDADDSVLRMVIHVLCDGSPARYRAEIVSALEGRYNDPDSRVRKFVRKVLKRQRGLGTVNVL